MLVDNREIDWAEVEEIGEKGRDIYEGGIENQLQGDFGRYIAVDVDDGNFLVDDDLVTVLARFRKEFGQRRVWTTRIGDPIRA